MDQATLVESQIDGAWRLVKRLSVEDFGVTAAFWMKSSEDGQRFLYVASSEVDDKGPRAAYNALLATLRLMPDVGVDPFEIKLIGARHPIARAVLDFQRQHPARLPSRYREARLGGVTIDEAYLYPPIAIP